MTSFLRWYQTCFAVLTFKQHIAALIHKMIFVVTFIIEFLQVETLTSTLQSTSETSSRLLMGNRPSVFEICVCYLAEETHTI